MSERGIKDKGTRRNWFCLAGISKAKVMVLRQLVRSGDVTGGGARLPCVQLG